MSGTTEALRQKISSASDLNGVVRSMKALAASSIGQYENAIRSLDDYYRTVELGLAVCLRQGEPAEDTDGPIAGRSESIGAIVFGSDQGLVGGFNEVIADFSLRSLKALPGKTAKIWAIGERLHVLLTATGVAQPGEMPVPTSVHTITPLLGQILAEVETARERGEITAVYIFHNRPKAGAAYEPTGKRILPLDRAWRSELAGLPWPTKTPPEVFGGAVTTLQAFIQAYLFVVLFQACAESLASENAARLAAMQRAEKNIDDMLDDLNRTFHRLRQEEIDEELFDVVSGFNALSGRTSKARLTGKTAEIEPKTVDGHRR